MKVDNATVDVEKLGRGIYELMLKHPDGQCLSLGMLVAEIMEAFQNQLMEKIPSESTRRKVTHLVVVEVLKIASDEGVCVV